MEYILLRALRRSSSNSCIIECSTKLQSNESSLSKIASLPRTHKLNLRKWFSSVASSSGLDIAEVRQQKSSAHCSDKAEIDMVLHYLGS